METIGQSIVLYNELKELENLVAQALQQLQSPSTAFDMGFETVNSTIIELKQFLKVQNENNETKKKNIMNETRKCQSEEKAAKPTRQFAVHQYHSFEEPLQSTLHTGFVVISVYVNTSQRNLVNFHCSLLT